MPAHTPSFPEISGWIPVCRVIPLRIDEMYKRIRSLCGSREIIVGFFLTSEKDLNEALYIGASMKTKLSSFSLLITSSFSISNVKFDYAELGIPTKYPYYDGPQIRRVGLPIWAYCSMTSSGILTCLLEVNSCRRTSAKEDHGDLRRGSCFKPQQPY